MRRRLLSKAIEYIRRRLRSIARTIHDTRQNKFHDRKVTIIVYRRLRNSVGLGRSRFFPVWFDQNSGGIEHNRAITINLYNLLNEMAFLCMQSTRNRHVYCLFMMRRKEMEKFALYKTHFTVMSMITIEHIYAIEKKLLLTL